MGLLEPGPAMLLRIHLGEHDRHGNQPLYQAIVALARDRGLAGATVVRGLEGYGAAGVVHTTRILSASGDLPVIVEIIDQEASIRLLLDELAEMLQGGLITLQPVEIVAHRDGVPGLPAAHR
jgi:uncharacterized protein